MEEWLSYRLGDFLMFSDRAYWRLFQLQNAALWPLPAVAPAAAAIAMLLAPRRPAIGLAILAGLLALAWVVVGWSFIWHRYAPINWGVVYALPLFGLQAVLLTRVAARGTGVDLAPGWRAAPAWALLGWGVLLHPLSAPLLDRPLAQAEIIGIAPDPTAIATLGLALMLRSRRLRLVAAIVPALWLGFSGLTLWLLDATERAVPVLALAVTAIGLAIRRGDA